MHDVSRVTKLLFTLAILAPAVAHGQVVGTVRNNFGAPVKGAAVSIKGSAFAAATDEEGQFSLDFVPGEFVVEVTAIGHAGKEIPLKLFSKDKYPMSAITLVQIPPADGFRVAAGSTYGLVPTQKLDSRQRKTGQFKPPCTDLLPKSAPVASGLAFVAFTPPTGPGVTWAIVRPTQNGIPGMPGGLVDQNDCGAVEMANGTWTKVDSRYMFTSELPDGVYCLAKLHSLAGMMQYIDAQAACFTWKKGAAVASAPTSTRNGGSAPAVRNPFTDGSIWRGSYECAKVPSELELKIVGVEGPAVRGVFAFSVPSKTVKGSFHVLGQYDAERSTIRFAHGDWIEHPPGFSKVGMVGTLTPDGAAFQADFGFAACPTFKVTRADQN